MIQKDCDGCCYNQKEENGLGCNKVKCCYLNEDKKCMVYEKKVNYYE